MVELELKQLQQEIVACERCPRLVEYRQRVAREKRRAYRDWQYWGKPVPSWGRPTARVLILGLAPAAHGANRTGRMFTGDRSGDFLYQTLSGYGFCNQPKSQARGDGLELRDAYVTAALHCVPPANKPSPEELRNCRAFLLRELRILAGLRVVVALGQVAWQAYLIARKEMGLLVPRPRPPFGHGRICRFEDPVTLVGSYHPSQQNTLTGRLTREMFDEVFARVVEILEA